MHVEGCIYSSTTSYNDSITFDSVGAPFTHSLSRDIIGADVTLSLDFYTYHIYTYSMATREATNAMGGEQKKQKTDGSKSTSRYNS
jgi:hypothetical protein